MSPGGRGAEGQAPRRLRPGVLRRSRWLALVAAALGACWALPRLFLATSSTREAGGRAARTRGTAARQAGAADDGFDFGDAPKVRASAPAAPAAAPKEFVPPSVASRDDDSDDEGPAVPQAFKEGVKEETDFGSIATIVSALVLALGLVVFGVNTVNDQQQDFAGVEKKTTRKVQAVYDTYFEDTVTKEAPTPVAE